MKRFISLTALAAAATLPAMAADVPGKTSFALRASTLGFGAELAHTLPIANLTGRVAWNGYTYETSDTIEGVAYDVELDLSSITALVDWRPWGTVTHFTAGLVFNSNEFGALGQPAGTYTIGGMTFSATDVGNLTGRTTFDDVVPYAGLGWNIPIAPKTALSLELGVVFQGAPSVTLEADGLLATDPVFQAELEAERAEFEQDIKDYEYYPVLGIGVSRKF
ncbi:MAG: hypothetical protein KJO54_03135 [Gammaproteobacteria bacterium]|nr:hypothetical protein [Gammaproteobacteria bacterium]NNF61696.1 hypothetical protein [Gammaproteobacteria bacterium]NNM20326.1 hypothetical protein [Gammaproteobacteria bacterium]